MMQTTIMQQSYEVVITFPNASSYAGTADDVLTFDLPGIAAKYKNGECDKAAEAMQAALVAQGKRGEIITLSWTPIIGHIWSDIKNMSVGNNGFHMGVAYQGKVYCNIHPYGLSEAAWIADFNSHGIKVINRVPF